MLLTFQVVYVNNLGIVIEIEGKIINVSNDEPQLIQTVARDDIKPKPELSYIVAKKLKKKRTTLSRP